MLNATKDQDRYGHTEQPEQDVANAALLTVDESGT